MHPLSRWQIKLEHGCVLAVDHFARISDEAAEKLERLARELLSESVESEALVKRIQIAPANHILGDVVKTLDNHSFHRRIANDTEKESGEAIAKKNKGHLKPNSDGHKMLKIFADGKRRTAYEASVIFCGNHHGKRREVRRLMDRGLLRKNGKLANTAPEGRPNVDAYEINLAGELELMRLNRSL